MHQFFDPTGNSRWLVPAPALPAAHPFTTAVSKIWDVDYHTVPATNLPAVIKILRQAAGSQLLDDRNVAHKLDTPVLRQLVGQLGNFPAVQECIAKESSTDQPIPTVAAPDSMQDSPEYKWLDYTERSLEADVTGTPGLHAYTPVSADHRVYSAACYYWEVHRRMTTVPWASNMHVQQVRTTRGRTVCIIQIHRQHRNNLRLLLQKFKDARGITYCQLQTSPGLQLPGPPVTNKHTIVIPTQVPVGAAVLRSAADGPTGTVEQVGQAAPASTSSPPPQHSAWSQGPPGGPRPTNSDPFAQVQAGRVLSKDVIVVRRPLSDVQAAMKDQPWSSDIVRAEAFKGKNSTAVTVSPEKIDRILSAFHASFGEREAYRKWERGGNDVVTQLVQKESEMQVEMTNEEKHHVAALIHAGRVAQATSEGIQAIHRHVAVRELSHSNPQPIADAYRIVTSQERELFARLYGGDLRVYNVDTTSLDEASLIYTPEQRLSMPQFLQELVASEFEGIILVRMDQPTKMLEKELRQHQRLSSATMVKGLIPFSFTQNAYRLPTLRETRYLAFEVGEGGEGVPTNLSTWPHINMGIRRSPGTQFGSPTLLPQPTRSQSYYVSKRWMPAMREAAEVLGTEASPWDGVALVHMADDGSSKLQDTVMELHSKAALTLQKFLSAKCDLEASETSEIMVRAKPAGAKPPLVVRVRGDVRGRFTGMLLQQRLTGLSVGLVALSATTWGVTSAPEDLEAVLLRIRTITDMTVEDKQGKQVLDIDDLQVHAIQHNTSTPPLILPMVPFFYSSSQIHATLSSVGLGHYQVSRIPGGGVKGSNFWLLVNQNAAAEYHLTPGDIIGAFPPVLSHSEGLRAIQVKQRSQKSPAPERVVKCKNNDGSWREELLAKVKECLPHEPPSELSVKGRMSWTELRYFQEHSKLVTNDEKDYYQAHLTSWLAMTEDRPLPPQPEAPQPPVSIDVDDDDQVPEDDSVPALPADTASERLNEIVNRPKALFKLLPKARTGSFLSATQKFVNEMMSMHSDMVEEINAPTASQFAARASDSVINDVKQQPDMFPAVIHAFQQLDLKRDREKESVGPDPKKRKEEAPGGKQ